MISDSEWVTIAVMLEAFPGDFPPRAAKAYRLMLEGALTGEECIEGIRRYVARGERWRPGPGEIVALAGRAVALPAFGAVREELTRACRTRDVRLARTPFTVGAALMAEVPEGVVSEFVALVGGERIRRTVLYLPDDAAERAWSALQGDYEKLQPKLIDRALGAPARRALTR